MACPDVVEGRPSVVVAAAVMELARGSSVAISGTKDAGARELWWLIGARASIVVFHLTPYLEINSSPMNDAIGSIHSLNLEGLVIR